MEENFGNPQVAALPAHLKQYIVPQQYEKYTAIDQAVWRYVMRQNYHHLRAIAYYPYIPGLKKAGLSIERIPSLQEMNDALGKIGWGAVTVDGFIPPAAFMDFQAHRVLVIAADIRRLEHIAYTPAPDIIHESAGHAPIIAEEDYHDYLAYFGLVGTKALSSAEDMDLYEAIRELSILKEMPDPDPEKLRLASERVARRQQNMGEPSEMALLSRLHWWTVEYGLIGTPEDPKIYGAGLLSSIGESADCMRAEVSKVPYSPDAVNYPYDITQPQPQLFVTPDFAYLREVLDQFADTMAFRRGGLEGLNRAIASGAVCTAGYDSGLQVSGVFSEVLTGPDGRVAYIRTTGPTALSVKGKELPEHGKTCHREGFGSPVGQLKAHTRLQMDKDILLEFESGITVIGRLVKVLQQNGELLLLSFANCTVRDAQGGTLFDPAWGSYDMALGGAIVTVYNGVADKAASLAEGYQAASTTWHPVYSEAERRLQALYQHIRDCRENCLSADGLRRVWEMLRGDYPEDWLGQLEILEIMETAQAEPGLQEDIRQALDELCVTGPEQAKLIRDGLSLLTGKEVV